VRSVDLSELLFNCIQWCTVSYFGCSTWHVSGRWPFVKFNNNIPAAAGHSEEVDAKMRQLKINKVW